MLVKDYMMKHPPMVGSDMSIVDAQHLMNENAIQYLPVVKDGKRLVGLLTRESMLINPGRLSSLDVWDIAHYLANLKVKDVMIKRRDLVTIEVEEEQALETTRALIRKGFAVGPSSGLNYFAALEMAKRLEPSQKVVTVFPDRMERYFSTALFLDAQQNL